MVDTKTIKLIFILASSRLNPGVFRAWDDNKFYVPSSWEVVHQILPETRRDLVPLLEYTDAQIYNILGIPESVAKGNLGNKVGNIQATNDIFKTTIKWWKQTLSQVFTTCYNIIYGASDMAFLMQNVIANSNKEGEISNESGLLLKNMHDIVSEKGFEVVLPNTPFVSMDELFLLAQTGVITPEEYQMYMRKLANLPLLQ